MMLFLEYLAIIVNELVGGCGVTVFNAALLGCWIGDSNLYPGVGNIFRTADQFKPGIILRTGPQNNVWHKQNYYNS